MSRRLQVDGQTEVTLFGLMGSSRPNNRISTKSDCAPLSSKQDRYLRLS